MVIPLRFGEQRGDLKSEKQERKKGGSTGRSAGLLSDLRLTHMWLTSATPADVFLNPRWDIELYFISLNSNG